jgi:hypothetical protein
MRQLNSHIIFLAKYNYKMHIGTILYKLSNEYIYVIASLIFISWFI